MISEGAEAIIELVNGTIKKTRVVKSYRHPVLDKKLRKSRTRREAKILRDSPVRAPKLISMDDKNMVVEMEFVDGPQLRDHFNEKNLSRLGIRLGELIKKLHDAGIIHGDLTTSNFIVKDKELVMIDFGLSFFSDHVEHKAVDMHVLKQSLEAKHPEISAWNHVMKGYEPDNKFLNKFKEVELRGRYKQKSP